MYFIVIVFAFIALLEVLAPHVSKKTVVFGVSIPEPYVQQNELQRLKKNYSLIISGIAIGLILLQIALINSSIDEGKCVLISFVLLYVLLLIDSALYMIYHNKTKKLKSLSNWEADVKAVHVMDLTLRDKVETLPSIFFTVPIIMTLALITYTYLNYAAIPDVFATHWNISGEPDGWTEKSWINVIYLPLILLGLQISFFIMHKGLLTAKMQLSVQNQQSSAIRELQQRKNTSWYFAIVNFGVTILLIVLHFTSTILQQEKTNYFLPLFIGFIVITLGGLLLFVWQQNKNNEPFLQTLTNETAVNDDEKNWKWGIIYMNKEDPSFLVQKRFGIGWTVNLANKWTYVLLILMFLPIIFVVFT